MGLRKMSVFSISAFENILNQRFRWPTSGDRLFGHSASVADDAAISHDPLSRLYDMTEGYKRAADMLIEHGAGNRIDRHYLVYPVIFCYRHYLELSLKTILLVYGSTVDITPNWKAHDLNQLWPLFEKVLRRHGANDEADAVVRKCVAEFSKIDPKSITFRYPVSQEGKPVEIDLEGLDLLQLREVMKGIYGYFSGVDGIYTN